MSNPEVAAKVIATTSDGRRKGANNANWKGGQFKSKGRWFVWLPEEERGHHPTVHHHGYILRYHLNWNLTHPDDPVRKGEVIHHIDHNRENDAVENLEKLSAQTTHAELHGEEKKARTQCPRGHPYDDANTYWRPDGRGRDCRACRSAANRKVKSTPEGRERLRANKRASYRRHRAG